MSLSVSKECFPDTSKCHNCMRKLTNLVKKETVPKGTSKRCSSCHLMTYCDADCQRQHWLRVHKKHCRFLSGKTPVKNSTHDSATCSRCIQERETTRTHLVSKNSPKTSCRIEEVNEFMKMLLSSAFGFHGEGKKCDCSLKHGLQLPFPLGEVSGQYLEIAGTGLDAMLAHALKLLDAMMIKAKDEEDSNALGKLAIRLMKERAQLWLDILVCGKPQRMSSNNLFEQVDSLRSIFGASDPWWKILNFSVKIIVDTMPYYISKFHDSRSLEDPRLQKFKLINEYRQSQLQNQAMVSEKKMWPKFMLWPQLVNGKLAVLLPPGTLCNSCNAQLTGEAAITPKEVNSKFLPILLAEVGENGVLAACCSLALKPSCVKDLRYKNVEHQMKSNETEWNEMKKEADIFFTEARDCDFCFKTSLSSHRCSACLAVQYCSTDCQKEDLKDFHRTVCDTWAKDDSRKILGGRKQKRYWKKDLGE